MMHELRGAPEPLAARPAAQAVAGRSGAGRGLQARAHSRSSKSTAPQIGKPLLHPDDDWIVAIAVRYAAAAGGVPVVDIDDIEEIADVLLAEAMPLDQIADARAERL